MNKMMIDLIIMIIAIAFVMIKLENHSNEYYESRGGTFSTVEMNEKDAYDFLKKVNIRKCNKQRVIEHIKCYDVFDSGNLLVGCDELGNREKSIYVVRNGEIIYGYKFKSMGGYLVEATKNGAKIYWIRSSIVAEFDFCLEKIKVKRVISDENTEEHISYLKNERKMNGTDKYTLNKNGLLSVFANGYLKITKSTMYGDHQITAFENKKGFVINEAQNIMIVLLSSIVYLYVRKKF